MASSSTLIDLLTRVRKRLMAQLTLDKGALALAIGMAGVIVLLLAGTQILDWYWPVLLAAVSLAIGIYQLRKASPSLYKLAQRIDKRLGLADTLSTAIYFSESREPLCERQRSEAEKTAAQVDFRQAVPYTRSRFLLPAAGLALVACGLFAVRYAVTGSISLEPSLLKMAFESFFTSPQEQAKTQTKGAKLLPQQFDPGQPDNSSLNNEIDPDNPFQAASDPQDPDKAGSQDNSKEGVDNKGDDPKGADQQDDKGGDKSGKGDSKDGKDSDKQGNDKDGNPDKSPSTSQTSLLDKLKDALSDMLGQKNPSDQQKSKAGKSNKQQKSDPGQKGDKGDSQDQKGGDSSTESGQDGDKSQNDDAKTSQQQGRPSAEDAKSGAGSQDGEKRQKDAKMLEAMGKTSEILGKRAATVTGEVLVEVGSTKQQLKTPFSNQQATHAEAGSEIHRDEIPLMYQQYVERYFEEVRKTAAAAAAAKKSN